MQILNYFSFLICDYKMSYKYQEFENCLYSSWRSCTHSFYNDSGCFTIHYLAQRPEIDFYYAPKFSTLREDLCKDLINVCLLEPEIWQKRTHILFVKNPFFWCINKNILSTTAEVIKKSIDAHSEFFGIHIRKHPNKDR